MYTHPTYRDRSTGRPVDAVHHTTVLKSSDIFPWHGLQLEIARSRGWNVDDLMVDGHLIAFNLAERALQYRIRSESRWLEARLPPGGFWIQPEGEPFSINHDKETHYASLFVDGGFLDGVCGRHYELNARDGVVDETLALTVRALMSMLLNDRAHAADMAEHLIRAFVCGLATRHGHPAPGCLRGGIAPAQLKALLTWLEGNLQASLTVTHMADRVGLSAAHFSREFKRSTGRTPWEYVVELRLEGARRLLESGEPVRVAALQYGFADQSHMSRLFKQRYGVTPSSFVKVRRGWSAASAGSVLVVASGVVP